MRDQLARHRQEFERLARMAGEDYERTTVTRIAPEFTRLEDNWAWPRPQSEWGITASRWNEYRALFKQLELPAGLVVVPSLRLELAPPPTILGALPTGETAADEQRRRAIMVKFPVRGLGMAGEGTEYGFLWSQEPPTQMRNREDYEFTTVSYGGRWYRYESVIR